MLAEKLKFVQAKLEAGDEGASRIWETMGVYLGYAIAHYADFYPLKHVLILGRCTSGRGGQILLDEARSVLSTEFPDLAARVNIQLPDEKSRRVGQSVAAASLPSLRGSEDDDVQLWRRRKSTCPTARRRPTRSRARRTSRLALTRTTSRSWRPTAS